MRIVLGTVLNSSLGIQGKKTAPMWLCLGLRFPVFAYMCYVTSLLLCEMLKYDLRESGLMISALDVAWPL